MKDYDIRVIALLAVLIALTIRLGWAVFKSSRQATRENRCQLCGQVLPTNGGDE